MMQSLDTADCWLKKFSWF